MHSLEKQQIINNNAERFFFYIETQPTFQRRINVVDLH